MFTDDLAEKFKDLAGDKYRPSNGTEGEIFFNEFCDKCKKESSGTPCQIIGKIMRLDSDDPEYPTEWQYGKDGQPVCTAFEEECPVKLIGAAGIGVAV